MGVMHWLQRRLAGDTSAELVIDQSEEEFAGLNMKQVIDAHMAWRKRLTEVVAGLSVQHPEVGEIGQDDRCTLGKWLHGEARARFRQLPEYYELRKVHEEFHVCAAEVLLKSREGDEEGAMQLLKGRFRALSDRVQLDIIRLYAAAKK